MTTAAIAGWRVLPVERADPGRLVERSVALLDGMAGAPPTLRWYIAASPAVVLGRGQRRLAVAAPDGLAVVERASGGGAVLLDESVLSLDVLLPARDPWLDGDLGAVFTHVGEAWARALSSLGVPGLTVHHGPSSPLSGGIDRAGGAAVCYASVGRGEVLAGGRKLVGLAQRRRRHGAVVQCGLLRAWAPGTLLRALGADPSDGEVARAAVGLDELLDEPPPDAAVMGAVQTAFAQRFGGGVRT